MNNLIPGSAIKYRPWQSKDINELVPRLKPADVNGIETTVGVDPRIAIETSMAKSERTWAIIIAGRVEGIVGIGSLPGADGVGVPWLLSSPIIEQYPRELLSEGRRWLKNFHRHNHTLSNVVDCRNQDAIRWLTHIGFSVVKIIPSHGIAQVPFAQLVSYRAGKTSSRVSKQNEHKPSADTTINVVAR